MHGEAWMSLLRKIPRNLHDTLMLLTTIGTEFSIQQIVRMEDDFLVIRGRLAGSSDAGRAFFIPYDQINYLGFSRAMQENQLNAFFSDAPVGGFADASTVAAAEAAANARDLEPKPEEPAPLQPAAVEEQETPKPEAKPVLADKAALLEKLRARAETNSRRHCENTSDRADR